MSRSGDSTADGRRGRSGKRARILIVDDDVDVTNSLKLGLENKGYLVETYNDPIDALVNIKQPDGYDLAIFDIQMPKMNGFELYRQFRKIDGQVRIFFMDANDVYTTEFKHVFPDIKAAGFFKKPVSIGQMNHEIDKVLRTTAEPGDWER
jgi:DNA-binding response OmpR family regulator